MENGSERNPRFVTTDLILFTMSVRHQVPDGASVNALALRIEPTGPAASERSLAFLLWIKHAINKIAKTSINCSSIDIDPIIESARLWVNSHDGHAVPGIQYV